MLFHIGAVTRMLPTLLNCFGVSLLEWECPWENLVRSISIFQISNPYLKEEVDIEIDFDNFEMNNLTNDKLIQELEMKILSSKEEFDDSELTRIYSKSKSSSDRNYFFVVLGIISLLAFIFSMLVYCYCRKKSISNGIRYIGQNGLKTEFFRIWFRFNEKKTKIFKEKIVNQS